MGKKSSPKPQPANEFKLPRETKQFYERELRHYRPEVYTGQRIAEQSPEELEYIQNLRDVGSLENQNPFYQNAAGILSDFYSTPFEESAHKAILDSTLAETGSNIEQKYALAGRGGSPAFAKGLGAGLTRAGHDVLSDYNRQRLSALNQAAGLAGQQFTDTRQRLGLLDRARSIQGARDQAAVRALRAPLDERNRAEAERIAAITGLLGGGGYKENRMYQAPEGSSPIAGALGGGLAAAGLGLGPVGILGAGLLGSFG